MKNCFLMRSSLLLGFWVLSQGVASASLVPCVISGTTVVSRCRQCRSA